MYQALILDVDGTLLNSEPMIIATLPALLEEYGVPYTPDLLHRSIGCPSEQFMEQCGLGDRAEEATRRWISMMAQQLDKMELFDGVQAVLDAPIRRGVVTSQARVELVANFHCQGITDRFEATVCLDDTPFSKPHPRPLLYCLEQMALSPQDVLFVGDTQYDRLCAQAAGVDFALALWGAGSPTGFEDATYILDHPEQLLALVAHT